LLKIFPTDSERLDLVNPVYESIPGWNADISECRSYDELPDNTKNYLSFISRQAGINIKIISVGAKRQQTFMIQ
ncbi:MAG: adenylosuccinate synthetase, partial [Ignavibacteria bacterium]